MIAKFGQQDTGAVRKARMEFDDLPHANLVGLKNPQRHLGVPRTNHQTQSEKSAWWDRREEPLARGATNGGPLRPEPEARRNP